MFDSRIELVWIMARLVEVVVRVLVVVVLAVVVDISDAAVVCSGRLRVRLQGVDVMVRVACAWTTRVDER